MDDEELKLNGALLALLTLAEKPYLPQDMMDELCRRVMQRDRCAAQSLRAILTYCDLAYLKAFMREHTEVMTHIAQLTLSHAERQTADRAWESTMHTSVTEESPPPAALPSPP